MTGPSFGIEDTLSCILGYQVWAVGRAADLLWVQIGERRSLRSFRGVTREVGEFALHIQCHWRITAPALGLSLDSEESLNLEAGLKLFQDTCLPQRIKKISEFESSSFRVILDSDSALEVFAENDPHEQWRFFRPGSLDLHWVFESGVLNRDE